MPLAKAASGDYNYFDSIIDGYSAMDENRSEIKSEYGKDSIFVFISFSMPDSLIKSYIAEARGLKEKNNGNITFVLRGFYENSYRKTTDKVAKLSGSRPVSIVVDPTLFKKYNVTQVPSVVRDGGDSYDKMNGATTIKYALEQFEGGK
jgi:type-F conjugative transfer system pilin assembly protein TrbC